MHRIRGKKVYLAGKITGEETTYKNKFQMAADYLALTRMQEVVDELGMPIKEVPYCKVMNPAVLPPGFEHEEYMQICFKMIDACDAIVLLRDWSDSKGATMEMRYATEHGKDIYYFDELIIEETVNQLGVLKEAIKSEINAYGESTAAAEDYIALDLAQFVLKNM